MKNELIHRMTTELETMCSYIAVREKDAAEYHAGKADAIRDILEDFYYWDERQADEHIKNMWDIMDEQL